MDLLEKKLLMEWRLKINRSKPLNKLQTLIFSPIAMLTFIPVSENLVVCQLNGISSIWISFVLHIWGLGTLIEKKTLETERESNLHVHSGIGNDSGLVTTEKNLMDVHKCWKCKFLMYTVHLSEFQVKSSAFTLNKWMWHWCLDFSVLQLRQKPAKQHGRKKELKEGKNLSHHHDGKILTLNLVKTWLERMSKLCTTWVSENRTVQNF